MPNNNPIKFPMLESPFKLPASQKLFFEAINTLPKMPFIYGHVIFYADDLGSSNDDEADYYKKCERWNIIPFSAVTYAYLPGQQTFHLVPQPINNFSYSPEANFNHEPKKLLIKGGRISRIVFKSDEGLNKPEWVDTLKAHYLTDLMKNGYHIRAADFRLLFKPHVKFSREGPLDEAMLDTMVWLASHPATPDSGLELCIGNEPSHEDKEKLIEWYNHLEKKYK